MLNFKQLQLGASSNVHDDEYDAHLIIATNFKANVLLSSQLNDVFGELQILQDLNSNFENEVTLTVLNKKRVIYSPTGPVDRDQDDSRRIADAAKAAVQKAIKAGSKRPLLINLSRNAFELSDQVALLAALEAAYIPLELREARNANSLLKIEKLGYWNENLDEARKTLEIVNAIELGRIVTRDIGGSDPERMSAPNTVTYVNEVLQSTDVKINVIEGQEIFQKEYPCLAAVNRAAASVPRHAGRVIKLEYSPSDGPVDTTLFLVGKGITYDTGGADVKAGGHMSGMHRDKCGAAFVAGFFKTLSILKPKGLKVHGTMCMVRNSIGEECYVSDELITTRAKKRVRVGNTDAEGRMVMVDLLCEAKENALNEVNPQLFTIATLTGHVIRAYGPNYTAVLSNGPAKALKVDHNLHQNGDLIADPYEISSIKREDYQAISGKSEYEDILQATNNPSTMDPRGHQFPAAFLIMASGLEQHGNQSEQKIPFSHVDIAGSSGPFPGIPTGAPLPSFAYTYIVPRL
ncbi:unnamed protein product [Brachionus calyciflorus]|uniref:Cytosol aminopeptidase domain-containing protein n=1 Tax=Brachionus calyciflorus TaxID=104777 RepID=A0A814LNT4_9BILA|nr:unnamed protein product [Brachionus calyciflorus]